MQNKTVLMRTMVFLALVVPVIVVAGEKPFRPVHTYSIVARDAATGELGVAVQSHWFSVGTVVSMGRGRRGCGGDAITVGNILRTARTRIDASRKDRATGA